MSDLSVAHRRLMEAALLGFTTSGAFAGDVERGKQVFQACAACHGDQPGGLGPNLAGVLGRKAGAREDYRYSPAMARAGFIWDEEFLRTFLRDPRTTVKGSKMPFDGLADERDIDDVVAFLVSCCSQARVPSPSEGK